MTDDEIISLRATVIGDKRWPDDYTVIWRTLPIGRINPTRTIRLSDEFIARVDAWAADQPDLPVRSEAIRRLVELGLKAKGK